MQPITDQRFPLSGTPLRGVLRIYNLKTDTSLLVFSDDMVAEGRRIRFALDLGTFPNTRLQREYETIGLESFAIDPIVIADADESEASVLDACRRQLQETGNVGFYDR